MLSVIKKAIAKLTGNATSADVLSGKTFYSTDPRTRQTGSIPTVTHPNPTASINTSTGVVTASHTQSAGYVASSGTTTGTLSLSTQAATTITPSTSSQTAVAAGKYTTGAVTVEGATYATLTRNTGSTSEVNTGNTRTKYIYAWAHNGNCKIQGRNSTSGTWQDVKSWSTGGSSSSFTNETATTTATTSYQYLRLNLEAYNNGWNGHCGFCAIG